jgi:hypothetical protein
MPSVASQHELAGATVVAIAADSGHRYLDTVFDDGWVQQDPRLLPDTPR